MTAASISSHPRPLWLVQDGDAFYQVARDVITAALLALVVALPLLERFLAEHGYIRAP
jgi:hypothetical protein